MFVCYALLCVISSFAIILKRKRKLVALLLLSYRFIVTINVLGLFLTVPWVGLQCVVVVFPDHNHLRFGILSPDTESFLRRNIRTKDSNIRDVAYKTLVRPILEYSSPVWSPFTKSNIHRIKMVKRRAARWALCLFSSLTCWVNLGGGLLRNGVHTPDYICYIRLYMVLLHCHFHHMLCILRCLQDIQHHFR